VLPAAGMLGRAYITNTLFILKEAVRFGHVEMATLLLDRGAEVNVRAGWKEVGGSILFLAKHYHSEEHPIYALIKSRGGQVVVPDNHLQQAQVVEPDQSLQQEL
jgi:hypothetical protein